MISWRPKMPRGAPSPLLLTSMILIAGFGALVGWLALTAEDPAEDPAGTAGEEAGAVEETPGAMGGDVAPEPPVARAPLAKVPDPALIEDGKYGPLPKIDGERAPWRVYARPFQSDGDGPRIAIVMIGLGLKQAVTQAAITRLPEAVSLVISPIAPDPQKWVAAAREAGHEVLLQLPMEPANYPRDDPGPHVLLTGAQAAGNPDRLDWLLSRITGYAGVAPGMGGRFSVDGDALRPVLAVLRRRGLMYLDTLPEATESTGLAARIAGELALPRVAGNHVIDTLPNRAAIDARLDELAALARRDGSVTAIAHPYPVTIERLARWLATLDTIGLELAPVTALATVPSGGGGEQEAR